MGEQAFTLRLPRRTLAAASVLLFGISVFAGMSFQPVHGFMLRAVIVVLTVVLTRQLLLLIFAVCERAPPAAPPERPPLVSVIVPAFNEAEVIEPALESLLALDHPDLELIVVDDGSTDDTFRRARDFMRRHPDRAIRVFSQNNSGKASALNLAIEHAVGDFVLCVDADSRVQPDAVRRGLAHFADPSVAAVGGAVEVANPTGLLTRFQQLEYTMCLNFTRRALSYFGAVTVIPGPIGLFRRDALAAVGGYDERRDMFAEDAELTVRLLSRGWRIVGDTSMIARTQAPGNLFALLRQRYRWKRGLFQAFDANVLPLLLLRGWRGVVIALFLIFECFLVDILNFCLLAYFLSHVLVHWDLDPVLVAYALIVGAELAAILVACGARGFPRNTALLLAQRLTYASVLLGWGVLALLDEWRSTRMDWDKLERAHGIGPAS